MFKHTCMLRTICLIADVSYCVGIDTIAHVGDVSSPLHLKCNSELTEATEQLLRWYPFALANCAQYAVPNAQYAATNGK